MTPEERAERFVASSASLDFHEALEADWAIRAAQILAVEIRAAVNEAYEAARTAATQSRPSFGFRDDSFSTGYACARARIADAIRKLKEATDGQAAK